MTASTSGTADDYLDLIDKIQSFLSTDGDLVSAGQDWEVLKYDGEVIDTELYLRGKGLAGADNIYVGLRAYENASADWFNIAIRPFLGHLSAATWANQPGAGPERGVSAWDQSIPFWIAADGRRFIVGFRVSTVDQIIHCGLLLPNATPLQYPLPIMVAGTKVSADTLRWSDTGADHRFFTHGGSKNLRPIRFTEGTYLVDLDTWPHSLDMPFRETYGDEYPIMPVEFSRSGGESVIAEVDGLFQIPGFGQATGNTFTIDGDNYVVLQNVFRTAENDYLAMRLT